MSVGINTEKLEEQIERLEKLRDRISNEFQTDEKGNRDLNEDFQSDTSKVVNEEFERFSKASKSYIEQLDEKIEYLKKVVTDSYIDYETQQNKLIDDNIATN